MTETRSLLEGMEAELHQETMRFLQGVRDGCVAIGPDYGLGGVDGHGPGHGGAGVGRRCDVGRGCVMWRLDVLDPESGWRDSGEGPWTTRDLAERFALAEVGVPWRVRGLPLVRAMVCPECGRKGVRDDA